MVNEAYKSKVHDLIKKSKAKGSIKTYKEFCESSIADETQLTTEETVYYISKSEEELNDEI